VRPKCHIVNIRLQAQADTEEPHTRTTGANVRFHLNRNLNQEQKSDKLGTALRQKWSLYVFSHPE